MGLGLLSRIQKFRIMCCEGSTVLGGEGSRRCMECVMLFLLLSGLFMLYAWSHAIKIYLLGPFWGPQPASVCQHRPCKSSRVALEHGVKFRLLGTYPSPVYDSDHQGCWGHRARHHRSSGYPFQADSHKTVLTPLTNAELPVSSDKNASFAG